MPITTILKQHRKHIILGIVLGFVFAAGVLTPNVSHALFGISLSGVVTGVFKLIAYIFNFIAGIFFAVGAWLVRFTLVDLNMHVADPALNPIADIGWRISRDIANLGFVLLTVIMAFMTIIRVQSYGAKKLLLNLIIAAVVVNFSFVIAGTLIDFSNTLTWFFIGRMSPTETIGTPMGQSGLTNVLANAFGPQKFLLEESDDPLPPDPSQEESGFWTFGVAVLSSIAGLFFIVFFTLLATIVLLMLAAMFLVRYVALTFLLVLAPLAWLFWVFPGLKSYNAQWWSNFWKYTFFAPAASFFVYLSLVAAENLAANQEKLAGISANLPSALANIVQNGTQMIVVAGLMIGAITVAQKMGIEGASIANKAKDGLMKGAKTYGKNRANMIGTKLAQSKYIGGTMSRFGLSGKKLKGTGEDIQKQREAAKAKHLEYQDKITKYKQQLKNKEINKEEYKELTKNAAQEGKLGIGKRIGLFAKDATIGATTRGLGGAVEGTGKIVDKQAMKKIEKGGWNKNLMKGAGEGAGLFKKPEKKDEQKTAAELEKDHKKLLKEKDDMLAMRGPGGAPRFKDEDLKELNKKIEFSENKLMSAKNSKYRSMSDEEIKKEYEGTLKKQKDAKTKDEKNLARKEREGIEKSMSGRRWGNTNTPGQMEGAIKELENSRDSALKNDLDVTYYNNAIEQLKSKKEQIENKIANRIKAYDAADKKISELGQERDKKFTEINKEIKTRTGKDATNEEIRNNPEIQAIEEKINTIKTGVNNVKQELAKKAKGESGWQERITKLEELESTMNKHMEDGEEKTKVLDDIKQRKEEAQERIQEIRNKREKKGGGKGGGSKLVDQYGNPVK